jgi:glycosyltransferase involved in cell wall biosynthesis
MPSPVSAARRFLLVPDRAWGARPAGLTRCGSRHARNHRSESSYPASFARFRPQARDRLTGGALTVREESIASNAEEPRIGRGSTGIARVSYFYDLPLPCRFAAPIQFLNTCHELAQLGVPTTVYCGPIDTDDPLTFYGLSPHENLRIVQLFSRMPGRLELWWRLPRILHEQRPNGFHFLISRGETGIALLRRLRRMRLPPSVRLVYEAHRLSFAHEAERVSGRRWRLGDALPRRAERVRKRERAAVEGADAILCLTPAVKAALEASFRVACPVLILPSGVALPVPPAPSDGDAACGDIDVIYVGKLEERKGLGILLAAMQHLRARRLLVLGGTPAQIEEHRRLAERYGVAERVTFTGFIAPAQVPDYLRRARVGVCPLPTGASVISEEFTSPLKLLEMMAHGVPVVATDLPSVRAIAEHGRTAILVPPDDARALASGIDAVLQSSELAERLRAAGRQRAAEFSWAMRARRLLDFLETLVPDTTRRHSEDLEPSQRLAR